jgi:hypothetical protein
MDGLLVDGWIDPRAVRVLRLCTRLISACAH